MEISPMPPISEDCSSQGESEMGDEGDSNFEQLMVSMLEERDKVFNFFINSLSSILFILIYMILKIFH
jgi:hypothetical protein